MNYPIEKVRKDSLNVLEDQRQVFNDSPCREGKEGQFIFFGNETILLFSNLPSQSLSALSTAF